jgi:hypothetical protein
MPPMRIVDGRVLTQACDKPHEGTLVRGKQREPLVEHAQDASQMYNQKHH